MAPDAFQDGNEDELDEKKQSTDQISTVDNIAKISKANEEKAKQDEIDRMPIDNSAIHHPWYQMCCSTPKRQKKSVNIFFIVNKIHGQIKFTQFYSHLILISPKKVQKP